MMVSLCLMAVAVSGEPSGVSLQDEQYIEATWQAYFYRTQEKLPELNVELLRRVAQVQQPCKAQWKSWMLLQKVEKPSQLAFLVDVARKWGPRENWKCLATEIVKLVKTPEDEKMIRPILDDEKLFPDLLDALLRTTDADLLKRIFAEKNAETNFMGMRVLNFAGQRRVLKLPVDPQMAEPFMKAWVCRIHKPGPNYPTEALLAADLGYSWSVELLMEVIQSQPVIFSVSPDKAVDQQAAELARRTHLETQGMALVALQKLVKQDFGADAAKKPAEYVDAAVAKAKAWWAENSKDPKYRLPVAKPVQSVPSPPTVGSEYGIRCQLVV